MTKSQTVNKWESKGLGKAPFKCVGMYSLPSRALLEANPSAYNSELKLMPKGFGIGSCEVCGISLTNNFLIESTCGRTFSVGCDCVNKTGDTTVIDEVKEKKCEIARQKRFAKREAIATQKMDQERIKNGGLTDYELFHKKREDLEKARIGALESVLMPVYEALQTENGGFAEDMINMIDRGKLPTSGAIAVCAKIYGSYYAEKKTGKTRGRIFEPVRNEGTLLAKQWFADARITIDKLEAS